MERILDELVKKISEIGNENVQELCDLDQCCFFELDGQMCVDNEKLFELLLKAAEYDIEYAQINLAYMYEYGIGTEENIEEAVKWYRKLAEIGNTDAMVSLGNCYYDGNGAMQDYITANSYYLKAAKAGNVKGMSSIADSYYWGKGLEVNQSIATEWYRKAAEQGDVYSEWALANINWEDGIYDDAAKGFIKVIDGDEDTYKSDAKYMLAKCYYLGKGVVQDYRTAVELFAEIAHEEPDAAYFLGECYRLGNGVETNQSIAIEWYRKAAELGDMLSELMLAKINWENENFDEAFKGFKKLFEGNDERFKRTAKYMLGRCYYHGAGVTQNYYTAVKMFSEMASEDADAAYYLGECYRLGNGVEQNDYKAFQNMLFCAQKGGDETSLFAQQYVADCYTSGRGVEKDMQEAMKWVKKNAEQGCAVSQYNLAIAYSKGDGVEANKELAMYWCSEAAKQGYENARTKLMEWSRYD